MDHRNEQQTGAFTNEDPVQATSQGVAVSATPERLPEGEQRRMATIVAKTDSALDHLDTAQQWGRCARDHARCALAWDTLEDVREADMARLYVKQRLLAALDILDPQQAREEDPASARVRAAAPALLAALKQALEDSSYEDGHAQITCDTLDQMRAAIHMASEPDQEPRLGPCQRSAAAVEGGRKESTMSPTSASIYTAQVESWARSFLSTYGRLWIGQVIRIGEAGAVDHPFPAMAKAMGLQVEPRQAIPGAAEAVAAMATVLERGGGWRSPTHAEERECPLKILEAVRSQPSTIEDPHCGWRLKVLDVPEGRIWGIERGRSVMASSHAPHIRIQGSRGGVDVGVTPP